MQICPISLTLDALATNKAGDWKILVQQAYFSIQGLSKPGNQGDHGPAHLRAYDGECCANGCLCSPEMSAGPKARRACGSVDNPGGLYPVRLLQSAVPCSR